MFMMLFIFLCFSGLFVMFLFLLRGQEGLQVTLQAELAETRAQLRALEIKVAVLNGEEVAPTPSLSAQNGPRESLANLDSLSMEAEKAPTPVNNALELKF